MLNLQINKEYSRFLERLCFSAGDLLFLLQYTAGWKWLYSSMWGGEITTWLFYADGEFVDASINKWIFLEWNILRSDVIFYSELSIIIINI